MNRIENSHSVLVRQVALEGEIQFWSTLEMPGKTNKKHVNSLLLRFVLEVVDIGS